MQDECGWCNSVLLYFRDFMIMTIVTLRELISIECRPILVELYAIAITKMKSSLDTEKRHFWA